MRLSPLAYNYLSTVYNDHLISQLLSVMHTEDIFLCTVLCIVLYMKILHYNTLCKKRLGKNSKSKIDKNFRDFLAIPDKI
jgi:uncharacterized membrane protein YciS (DUF1049 family)